jgi:hypothetical protein
MSEKIVGSINVVETELRGKYYPNFHCYVIIKDEKLPTGEFNDEQWHYAYTLEKVQITEIIEVTDFKQLPQTIRRFYQAMLKVWHNEKWTPYLFELYSKVSTEETEYLINQWLLTEKDNRKVIVWVKVAPKILSKKTVLSIPITERMLNKALSDFTSKNEKASFGVNL